MNQASQGSLRIGVKNVDFTRKIIHAQSQNIIY